MTINGNQLQVLLDTSVGEDGGTRNDFYRIIMQFAQGTGDLQMNLSYLNKRRITNLATPDQIDLAGGNVYIGRSGTALTFVEITTMLVVNISDTRYLRIGGSGNTFNTWKSGTNAEIILPPAYILNTIIYPSFFVINCAKNPAFAVTAGSGDVLQVFADGGNNTDYYLGLLGRDA